MNISSLLSDVVKKAGTKTAIIEDGRETSYRELWGTIERLSAAFYKIGIRENHRVALILPNGAQFIYCFFALLKINAIVSPLSPDSTPFELKSILDNLNPHAIISLSLSVERVFHEYPALLDSAMLILHGDRSSNGQIKSHYHLNQLFTLNENYTVGDMQTDGEHVATINYTYKGIGRPLGAMLSHKNYGEGVSAYIENTRMSSHHKVLSLLPLAYVYPLVGCMLAPLISGAAIVISGNYMPRSILKVIDNSRVNHFTAVPSIYNLLLQCYKKGDHDISSLTCCITGGAYMSVEMQHGLKSKMGIEALQGYGLTECLPVTWNRYEYNKPGTLGLPLRSNFHIRIMGDDGIGKGTNTTGEITVSGPTVTLGYFNEEEETRKTLKDGWLYTGDYGYLDDDGYLYFTGLKKNIAKVGGNMADLTEVQNVLLTHPHISDAFVYSKEDSLWGQVVVAKVVSRADGDLTESMIKTFCGRYLSRHKISKMVEFTTKDVQR